MKMVRWQPQTGLRRWRPYDQLDEVGSELDRAFGWAFQNPWWPTLREDGFAPAADVTEDENHFTVHVDLPGMKQSDIDVTIDGSTLTIQGEKKRESEVNQDNYYRVERNYGKFSRSFTLPSSVDSSKIEANYKDGVLTISIPKTAEARSRKIRIES